MPLGTSYSPLSQEDPTQRKPLAGRPVQEAIKMLSLRMPRVQGAQALAPSALLNAPGSQGMSMEALRKLLQQLSGGGAATPASAAAPSLAPPSLPSPAVPSLAPTFPPTPATPSYGGMAPTLAPPAAPSFAPAPTPAIPAAPSLAPAETSASWMSPPPAPPPPPEPTPTPAPWVPPTAPTPTPEPTPTPPPWVPPPPAPPPTAPAPSFEVPAQAGRGPYPLDMPPGWDEGTGLEPPWGYGRRRQV